MRLKNEGVFLSFVYRARSLSLVLGLFGIEGAGCASKLLPALSQKFLAFDLYKLDAVFHFVGGERFEPAKAASLIFNERG